MHERLHPLGACPVGLAQETSSSREVYEEEDSDRSLPCLHLDQQVLEVHWVLVVPRVQSFLDLQEDLEGPGKTVRRDRGFPWVLVVRELPAFRVVLGDQELG